MTATSCLDSWTPSYTRRDRVVLCEECGWRMTIETCCSGRCDDRDTCNWQARNKQEDPS